MLAAELLISEFMAANSDTLGDEDGQSSDWIEIANAGDVAADLIGWHLTDDAGDLAKWTFPSTPLGVDEYLVVFASGKDRRTSGAELHANFLLSREGEYLALVMPDGQTIVSQFGLGGDNYPEQFQDISYGIGSLIDTTDVRYFTDPTPWQANSQGIVVAGPIITGMTEPLMAMEDDQDIVVTAAVAAADHPVNAVTLHYRVMYGAESPLAMVDDGDGADQVADDGIYTATIPAAASAPGEMVRWYVTATDTSGDQARAPLFLAPQGMPEYFGTVIADPAVETSLEVLQWFVEDDDWYTNSGNGGGGGPLAKNLTSASVFYLGEFYDNVQVRIRGASSVLWEFPKQSLKFEFNPGQYFHYSPGYQRVEEINVNALWQDKGYIRNALAMEVYRDAGVPYTESFFTLMYRNGRFHSVAGMVEQVDETMFERVGLGREGALYKVFNSLSDANPRPAWYPGVNPNSLVGVEKKTRRWEDHSDLQTFINGLRTKNPTVLFDILDVPSVISYLAASVIIADWDMTQKNWYVYRDTEGTGEWSAIPWDRDNSWGYPGWMNDNITVVTNPLFHNNRTPLHDAIYDVPVLREMYLRRLRTVLDDLLQPPGTPAGELKLNARIDEFWDQMHTDVDADKAKWGNPWGQSQNLRTALNLIKNNYLAPARNSLYASGLLPPAQVGNAAIDFGAVEYNPASGNQDDEYIQLLNTNPVAVDISGWQLTGGVETTFQAGTVIPAGDTLYVSPDVTAFRGRATAPTGGMGLFVQGYNGHLSNFGETIMLVAADGQTVAETSYQGSPSPQQLYLRVSELNYNPHPADLALGELDVDPDEFEFIELINTSGTETLDLNGVRFTDGVIFDFTTAVGPTLLSAGFDADAEGFTYADDAFNGTNGPSLALGNYDPSGGLTGGGLHVKLGPHRAGIPTSAAWSQSFQLAGPETVGVALQFRMILGAGCEVDEFGEVILEVDGVRYGNGANNSLVHANGDGNSGSNDDTGWLSASFTVPLAAGNHTITVGAYNNKQNSSSLNEYVEAFIDDVVVTEIVTEATQLGPGGRVLVVSNRDAFESRYGTGLNVAGQFLDTRLGNNGERVKLDDLSGSTIVQIDYDDSSRWPGRADGKGASLAAVDTAGDYDDPDNWQSSVAYGGTPGGESL
ncbi:MAG: CotH kinase family protein, partial [Candidatus Nealsonbacteria bacterium]|nr:CotH kinase family protein [Candidatus Nealsonbacteria bacterium]